MKRRTFYSKGKAYVKSLRYDRTWYFQRTERRALLLDIEIKKGKVRGVKRSRVSCMELKGSHLEVGRPSQENSPVFLLGISLFLKKKNNY